jgi:hypothetical protein
MRGKNIGVMLKETKIRSIICFLIISEVIVSMLTLFATIWLFSLIMRRHVTQLGGMPFCKVLFTGN